MTEDDILDIDLTYKTDKVGLPLVTVTNFLLLSVLSWGLYPIWWSYKAWRFYRNEELLDILPAARALFTVIFSYSLFAKILSAKTLGYQNSYSPGLLYATYFFLNILYKLLGLLFLLSFLAMIAFIPPIKAMNHILSNYKEVHSTLTSRFPRNNGS